jgi:hypothetical protein
MEKSNWTVAYASVIGNLHIRENIPCQDSCFYLPIDKDLGIAAVADGAGSHVNSHIGSEQAAQKAAECFKEVVEKNGWTNADSLPSKEEWQQASVNTFKMVREDAEALAEKRGLHPQSLSCTIIVAIHAPDFLLVTHIGDGRAGYYNGEKWKAAMVPYSGIEANETIFLHSLFWHEEDRLNEFIRSYIFKENIDGFVLMTDGCEKSAFEMNIYNPQTEKWYDPNRPFDKFLNPNMNGLKILRKENKSQEEINELWKSFLEKGTKHFQTEVDDKTMLLGVKG